MLRRADFENDAVAWRVANPSSFGYHHGPVPYSNQQLANTNNDANQPRSLPSNSTAVSKVNTGVCDIEIDDTGTMCGIVFGTQPSFRRHLRDSHPGAAQDPTRTNVTVVEQLQGENAIKRWVLTGGWRDARYVREPGRGPAGGLVGRYADACERIAREDDEFRRKFGEFYHRRVMQEDPGFQPGRKSRTKRSTESAAEAEAPAAPPPPPPAGPTRSAQSAAPRRRSGGPRGGRARELILISDDEEEEVKVKAEPYSP